MITKKESYFLAQLWTYDNMTMALSCKEGEWEYQNLTWELPAMGTEGYIMESLSGTVLTVCLSCLTRYVLPTALPIPVVLSQVNPNLNESQLWMPMRNHEGFFTIEHLASGQLLTMVNNVTTTIEGKSINH